MTPRTSTPRRGRGRSGPGIPRTCNTEGCDIQVFLAFNPITTNWAAFETTDVPPWTQQAAGAYVLVNGQAWRPTSLVEEWVIYHEIPEEKAKDLVSGYPWHRAHYHPREQQGDTP